MAGSAAFHAVLKEMASLHDKKSADYGLGVDPLANCRSSAQFGIPPWQGVMIRAEDKMIRIKSFCQKGVLANEGIEDALIDLANYAAIALVLYREGKEETIADPLHEGVPQPLGLFNLDDETRKRHEEAKSDFWGVLRTPISLPLTSSSIVDQVDKVVKHGSL